MSELTPLNIPTECIFCGNKFVTSHPGYYLWCLKCEATKTPDVGRVMSLRNDIDYWQGQFHLQVEKNALIEAQCVALRKALEEYQDILAGFCSEYGQEALSKIVEMERRLEAAEAVCKAVECFLYTGDDAAEEQLAHAWDDWKNIDDRRNRASERD